MSPPTGSGVDQDAMAQYVDREVADVLRNAVVASVHQGPGLRGVQPGLGVLQAVDEALLQGLQFRLGCRQLSLQLFELGLGQGLIVVTFALFLVVPLGRGRLEGAV